MNFPKQAAPANTTALSREIICSLCNAGDIINWFNSKAPVSPAKTSPPANSGLRVKKEFVWIKFTALSSAAVILSTRLTVLLNAFLFLNSSTANLLYAFFHFQVNEARRDKQ